MVIEMRNIVPIPLEGIYDEASEVWGTDLTFKQGEFSFVSSESGKGKSTLLSLIYGIRRDFTGELLIDGRNSSQLNHNDWAELRQDSVSMVFQGLRMFMDLNGWENIRLKSVLNPRKSESEVAEIAKALGIDSLMGRPCKTWSHGQRQRLALIRAMVQPFKFLLLDEPFSHLDERNQQIACELITDECKSQNAALVIASLGEEYFFNYDRKIRL